MLGFFAALSGLASAAKSVAPATLSARSQFGLLKLADAEFANLTHAERALLEFADVSNTNRSEWAAVGPSANPLDSSNDPKDAAKWTHDRDIRAGLIRWLTVDHAAIERVDPKGIRILGARITGPLDLSYVRVPFAITMVRCAIPERMTLQSTEIPQLDLNGTYTAEIFAPGLNVRGDLDLGWDNHEYGEFHAAGEVYLQGAKVGGQLSLGRGHFHYSKVALFDYQASQKIAIDISDAEIKRSLTLCCGFESDGAVILDGSTIGGDLNCVAGHFTNPNNVALSASSATINGNVVLARFDPYTFESDGTLNFVTAHVGGYFAADHAKFKGKASEQHGLNAEGLSVRESFVWHSVTLENGAVLDLGGASIGGYLLDDQASWPAPGKLLPYGFTYTGFGSDSDAKTRLRWLALMPRFNPQPYRQLARVLRKQGDDEGAVRVLIAEEDARYLNSPFIRRAWAGFLKATIGYGHEPLLTVLWSLAVVLLGWAMVAIGQRAGVMRPTWPETPPASSANSPYERLHPLLYSFDVFLPFVNFHQEHYWWPDADVSGECAVFGQKMNFSGSFLRYYLWLQIVAGWMLSAIFLAGVTGLIRTFEE